MVRVAVVRGDCRRAKNRRRPRAKRDGGRSDSDERARRVLETTWRVYSVHVSTSRASKFRYIHQPSSPLKLSLSLPLPQPAPPLGKSEIFFLPSTGTSISVES